LARSVVGSPEYMSPEVTAGLDEKTNSYGNEVDWWSLGCVFLEMIVGEPPFMGESPQQVFESIRNWKTLVPQVLTQYSQHMSPEFFSLVSGFLCDPVERFGKDLRKLQKHTFFIMFKIDWNNLFKIEPPFIPNNLYPELESST